VNYASYSRATVEDVVRLRRRLDAGNVPPRRTDYNLLVATWNIRGFSDVFESWDENPDSPKRNLRAMAVIAEIVKRFDVVAIQEVKRNTHAIRMLLDEFLGDAYGVLMSDVTAGAKGNSERLAFIYDRRRVVPSGLAGEIVLPPTPAGDPMAQFDRTPYIVGFRAAQERFALLTAHIRYGGLPADRLPELQRMAAFTATEIRDRARAEGAEEVNLIVLGDFNIDERTGNPLFDAFVDTGLWVPDAIRTQKTTYGTTAKYYDQIAWFRDDFSLLTEGHAGVVDVVGAVFPEMTPLSMSYRVSDHFPLWVEFITDRSVEAMARTLGIDPAMPDPFGGIV
jgi:endonuclease/exonuclease/phosphatase family metal-dependent hydrolase